ncbi:unnamed protein product [Polarella glacialis]|uniref:Uncharacterized protein n=1 Tax=Polarella glacialis TaxID=89957 RepID=A0A813I7I3_POLGL|nr:unnamed protein product [Polarella glacialis]
MALVCSGQLSQSFDLSPAPIIDVPANGGRFVQPEGSECWLSALASNKNNKDKNNNNNNSNNISNPRLPQFGLACLSFSETFFFQYFAKRRAMARAAHKNNNNQQQQQQQ